MTRTQKIAAALILSIAFANNPATAASVLLQSVLDQLVAEGYPIVYSNDVVLAETRIDLPEITLAALRAALPEAGLDLQRQGDIYLITPLADRVAHEPGSRSPAPPPEENTTLETIIVTGTRHQLGQNSKSGSVNTLTSEEMQLTPSLGGDAMRVVTRLPGMSSVGVSAKPQVRGGLADEVLVRVDGVELFDSYHLADFQSFFSVVDDRTVDAVDVYTGGFPARYGNRMSGVVDISTRERENVDRTELGLSAISLFANTSGSFNDGQTRYLTSARHGNLKYLVNQLNSRVGTPKYYDAYGQISHQLSPDTALAAGTLLTRDDVSVRDDTQTANSRVDNRYLWFRLEHQLTERLSNQNLFTLSWSDRDRKLRDPLEEEDEIAGFLDYDQSVRKYDLRTDFSYEQGDSSDGIRCRSYPGRESRYDSTSIADRGDLGELLYGSPFESLRHTDQPQRLVRRRLLGRRIQGPGRSLRAARHTLGRSGLLRLRLHRSRVAPAWPEVRAHRGADHQGGRGPIPSTGSHSRTARRRRPSDLLQTPAFRSLHISASSGSPGQGWELRVDLYRKDYEQTKLRFENMFNPFVMIPELEADRVALAPDRAKARGVDVEIRKQLTDGLSAVVRYGYMNAKDRFSDHWITRRWSQRNTVVTMLAWQRETFSIAAAVTWHSGWHGGTPPAEVSEGETLSVEDIIGNTELREYFSIDISASRTWQFPRAAVTLFADVTNVLDRNNVAGVDWDATEEDGAFIFEPTSDLLLPLIPSAGILITF